MRRGRLRLAFVGSGSPEQAAQYVASLKLPDGIVGELLLDESTEAFGAFNLRKSVYASLVPSIVAGLRTHGLGAVSEGIRLGWKNAALAGDSWQQAGTFVLGFDEARGGEWPPKLLLSHAERWPGDWLSIEELLRRACGEDVALAEPGSGGGGSTSYADALQWYLALPPPRDAPDSAAAAGGELRLANKRVTVCMAGAVAAVCVALLLLPALGLLRWGWQQRLPEAEL